MFWRLNALLLLVTSAALVGDPKDKTFRNVRVLENLEAKNIFASGDISTSGNLKVSKDTTINGSLTVGSDVTIDGNLIIDGEITSTSLVKSAGTTTINAVARFANTTGTLIKNSSVLVDDAGNVELNGITKNGNTSVWPSVPGAANTFLGTDGAGNLVFGLPTGEGNVTTSGFTLDNALVVTDLSLSNTSAIKQTTVIVDGSGNIMTSGSLTAAVVNAPILNGHATSATNFTGSLVGDVIGTQFATTVSAVGGVPAAQVASGANLANAATPLNIFNTIVMRDSTGSFAANIVGNAQTAYRFLDPLSGDVVGTQFATSVTSVGGWSYSKIAEAAYRADTATSLATPDTLVLRDFSGDFAGRYITADKFIGQADSALRADFSGTATNFSGSLSGDVIGTQFATTVSSVYGQFAQDIAAGVILANNATNLNSPNQIVKRDANGDFVAGIITASLSGNATTATSAATAGSATNFSGSLSGDVIGTQLATTVTSVYGQTAQDIAAGVILANSATNLNSANQIVKRDASGNFVAGTITASLSGNATTATSATTAGSATNFSGSLSGDVIGTQFATTVTSVYGQFAQDIAAGVILANNATNLNSANQIVKRDASGNFVAGTITASLSGNATTATSATTAGSATNFSGSLSGEVIGTQFATTVSSVYGQFAQDIAAATILANNATNLNSANQIVKRDASGNFVAGTITASLSGNATTATSATTAGSATNFSGSLSGDVIGTQFATTVSSVYGQFAQDIAAGVILANNATNLNSANQIVKRDASGNFVAGTITANLSGNATTATSATTAGSATNLSGSLSGDVIGTQFATTVSSVYGQFAQDIAAGVILANNATNLNSANQIVKRDASGNFVAGTITASLSGNATTATSATTAGSATNLSGSLSGDVIGTQFATTVSSVYGQFAQDIAAGVILANNATNLNSANQIVKRDASGNFVAGTITASLSGNATTATSATTAGSATNFSGSLSGDVIGTQFATTVSSVYGQFAQDIAAGVILANNATNLNSPNQIVKRDASGNFVAGTIFANLSGNATTATSATTAGSATNFSGSLSGDVIGTQFATTVSSVYGQFAQDIAAGVILANNATNLNSPNQIVRRDASGNFVAGTITANLSGNATTATSATTAGSATNFSGSLSGDVIGTQLATTVTSVYGQSAQDIAAATILANNATNLNSPNQIVKRDANGDFAAREITANIFIGNATSADWASFAVTATNALYAQEAVSFTDVLLGDVGGFQNTTQVNFVGGQTAAAIAAATVLVSSATSNDNINTLVLRDGSGNFATNMITLDGSVTNPTDATTKAYVDQLVSLNVVPKEAVLVVSTVPVVSPPATFLTVDGVLLTNNDRVLLVAQADPIENGLWLAQDPGSWVRPADFNTGDLAGSAYVLTLSGATQRGSSWLCSTPTSTIGTDPIFFGQYSIAGLTTGANVGSGAGIWRDTTGATLNFKSLLAGPYITIANNADDITIGADATSVGAAGKLVALDAASSFTVGAPFGTITATQFFGSLVGNAASATLATSALLSDTATYFTGPLLGQVTGSQGATVVSYVGIQPAVDVVAATQSVLTATWAPTVNTLVLRDAGGNFSGNIITATTFAGNATSATSALLSGTATYFSGPLNGDVIGTQFATTVTAVGGQWAVDIANATILANTATYAATPNTLVLRDAGGNFSGNTITATTFAGNATSATSALLSGTATYFSGPLNGDVIGTQFATTVTSVGGQLAVAIANATILANTATYAATPNTLVVRDAGGDFSGNIITATTFAGNATSATSALLSGTATYFSGPLYGDVIGTQFTTTVTSVGGQLAVAIANATILANTATYAATPNTLVLRDAGGNFSGNIITATTFAGNATSATSALLSGTATYFSGPLYGDVIGTQFATTVTSVGGQLAVAIANATILANTATYAATPNTLVVRDAGGNFIAGTITADLVGDVTGNLTGNATSASFVQTATYFSGPLYGDVVGTQFATTVTAVGGQLAVAIANATILANTATYAATPNTLVLRDSGGNFSGNIITATTFAGNATSATSALLSGTATYFSGPLYGDVIGTQFATTVTAVGGQLAVAIANATILANTATYAATPNTLVVRDAGGNFSAGTIAADLVGDVTGNLTGNATSASFVQTATYFSGPLYGDVIGTQFATTVTSVGGQLAVAIANATILANTATWAPTINTLVLRDSGGNFSGNIITATTFAGNATSATSAITSGTATYFTGPLLGQVTGSQGATVVSFVGTQPAVDVVAATQSVLTATWAPTINTLVLRDSGGNFSGNIITATTFAGNATSATSALTSGTATYFTGPLLGQVTGSQGATVVSFVGTQPAVNVVAATQSVLTATWAPTVNTLVLRDAGGNFSAGTITADLVGDVTGDVTGNATYATSAGSTTNFSGPLSGDVVGTQFATTVTSVGGWSSASIAEAAYFVSTSTFASVPNTLVWRDYARDFAGRWITADRFIGQADSAVVADFAVTATNFSGLLAGDVVGTQLATTVTLVGGKTALAVAAATALVEDATSNASVNTLVRRDSVGSFTTNMITLTGTVANLTDAATKAYVDATAADVLVVKTPALVVSINPITVFGLQIIDGVTLVVGDRVLLIDQANPIENGLWEANNFAWTRPADFATGDVAQGSYVLVTGGASLAGSSYLSSTPLSIIGPPGGDPIYFVQIATPGQTTGANVGGATGQIFRDKTAITLNFKTLAAESHIIITDNVSTVTIGTDGTSLNTPNTLVARNGSGNFSAGTITASLTGVVTGTLIGNASTATLADYATASGGFSGVLAGDVTGPQPATVVALVNGKTAAQVAAATQKVEDATSSGVINNRLVIRDASGGFTAGTIVANLTGNASGNVLKTGDIMTGRLTLPAGTVADPALKFAGSANTGISVETPEKISLSTNGAERFSVSDTIINAAVAVTLGNILCYQGIQEFNAVANNLTVTVLPGKFILLLTHTANRTGLRVNFPQNPINGQLFTIMLATASSVGLINATLDGKALVNTIGTLNPGLGLGAANYGASVTYLYVASKNGWYRYYRG